MAEEEPIKSCKKAEKLNSDVYSEDLDLLNQTITEKSLSSRKEGLHAWANIVRGSNIEKEQECQYHFGNFCTNEPQPQKKLRKTTSEYCQACLQAQKNKALQDAGAKVQQELFDLCHVSEKDRVDPFYKWAIIADLIDSLNFEIEELKKPAEKYLEEITYLKTELDNLKAVKSQIESQNAILKQQLEQSKEDILAKELQKRANLENDNAFLKQKLEKMKHEPVFEKNAWLTVELQKANQEIEKLKAKNEQQTALINNFTAQRGS